MNLNYQKSKKALLNFRKIFILTSLALFTSTISWGQNQRITITGNNNTILKVFEEIEKQTGLSIAYNQTKLDINRKISQDFITKILSSVMTEVLKDTGFSYKIEDKHIVIVPARAEQTTPAQNKNNPKKISGVVLDATGLPIIGANVIVKGTTTGSITNLDGAFSLEVPEGSVLQISYIGYLTKEIPVKGNNTNFDIQLMDDTQALEEVVVVGYGSQKKVNVIGSIASVDSKALEARAVPDVSNMLTGQLSGVTITQESGNPGQDAGTIRVRGVGSFGATPSPLVLVDGLPGSLSDLTPTDIEQISVLKDASSSAIYGSRAANGVILVTTKKGKEGKARIIYNGSVGMSQATELPELARSYEYAEYYNMAIGKETYTPEMIQKYRDGSDPDNYANEMYLEDLLGGHALQTKHELSASGGTEKIQYMASLGYLHQDGLLDNNYYNRYNARVNLNAELAKNLKLSVRLSGMASDRHEPSTPGSMDGGGYKSIISNAVR